MTTHTERADSPSLPPFELLRNNVRSQIRYPGFETAVFVSLVLMRPHEHVAACITAVLLGMTVLLTAQSASAGMTAMELFERDSSSAAMKRSLLRNRVIGFLMLILAAWHLFAYVSVS